MIGYHITVHNYINFRHLFELNGDFDIHFIVGLWKDVVIVSDYFRSLFKIPKYWFSYVLILKALSDNNIIEILSCLNWVKSGQLVMYEGRVEKEVMQYLLDTLPSDVCLRIFSMIDYETNHEKVRLEHNFGHLQKLFNCRLSVFHILFIMKPVG